MEMERTIRYLSLVIRIFYQVCTWMCACGVYDCVYVFSCVRDEKDFHIQPIFLK